MGDERETAGQGPVRVSRLVKILDDLDPAGEYGAMSDQGLSRLLLEAFRVVDAEVGSALGYADFDALSAVVVDDMEKDDEEFYRKWEKTLDKLLRACGKQLDQGHGRISLPMRAKNFIAKFDAGGRKTTLKAFNFRLELTALKKEVASAK